MIVSRAFVLLHTPRTGGTWAAHSVLIPYAPAAWELREVPPKHGGIADIQEDARDLPRFAFVRSPWDWYVSWWAFHRRIWVDHDFAAGTGRDFFEGRLDIDRRDRWAALFALGLGPVEEFRAALSMLVEHESMTSRLSAVIGDGSTVTLLRYEDGAPAGVRRLAALCGDIPEAMEAALASPRIWESQRTEHQHYYTPALAETVAQADAGIIAAHGYTP